MMNVENPSILIVSGISLDKKSHVFIRIANNRGLEKGSLIQHKMIIWCIIFRWDTSCQIGWKRKGYKWSNLLNIIYFAKLVNRVADGDL